MEKSKKALKSKIDGIEPVIVELLNSRKVQLYIAVLNLLLKVITEFLEQTKAGKIDEEVRRKLVTLKKGKAKLENQPEVKLYLAILEKHAQLSDSYNEIESQIEQSSRR